jgi:hypothetical protein
VLFRTLTLGRYADLRIDSESDKPRLLGLCEDGRTLLDVAAMSEGTQDQLFLALRLAAAERAVEAGVRLPFLADDLFINFDDERSRAGLRCSASWRARPRCCSSRITSICCRSLARRWGPTSCRCASSPEGDRRRPC